ncbi:class I SAM-dependent methyltransferase [Rugamonas sp. CCM 8940]|uniref:class I SAM-dependent methyltransferase n=1 Tax=Rugamonas sp. CCM 8940 TaxID=2765359 RepID=UPI00351CB366
MFDLSGRQLDQDCMVAAREGLGWRTVQGDMRDLSVFADTSFDYVFHPILNLDVPEMLSVWRECYRVLKYGAKLHVLFGHSMALEPDTCSRPERRHRGARHRRPRTGRSGRCHRSHVRQSYDVCPAGLNN